MKQQFFTSKTLTFAPVRNGHQAARMWKVWASGDDIYLIQRSAGSMVKISIHKSGEIHYRTHPRERTLMYPLRPIDRSWQHALEFRFLIEPHARRPPREDIGKCGFKVDVPEGKEFLLNLFIASPGTPEADRPFPNFFPVPVWRIKLRDGRITVLTARLMDLSQQSKNSLAHVRETGFTINTSKFSKSTYCEIVKLHHMQGDNVVLITPLGDEAIRVKGRPISKVTEDDERVTREFWFETGVQRAEIKAPNGVVVGVISLQREVWPVLLVRHGIVHKNCGEIALEIFPEHLIPGSPFALPPIRIDCPPLVGGASPNDWKYVVSVTFDGDRLDAKFHGLSSALRNENIGRNIKGLLDGEQILLSNGDEPFTLNVSLDAPVASRPIPWAFCLGDI